MNTLEIAGMAALHVGHWQSDSRYGDGNGH